MTNISKETRAHLEANYVINHIEVDNIQRSKVELERIVNQRTEERQASHTSQGT